MRFPEILILIVSFAAFVFELAMLIDVWRSGVSTAKKILWTVSISVFNLLAALVYFFGFRQKIAQVSN